MSNGLTARDIWPLIVKLPHDERIQLAKLALKAAATDDEAAYEGADEFTAEDPLAWEGEGWEEFRAKG